MKKKIAISSSMKFRPLIKQAMKDLSQLGFQPLFPNLNSPKILTLKEKNKFAKDHYRSIDQADAVYFILPDGYIGTSCQLELGYSLGRKKPIYFSELTHKIELDGYPKKIIPLNQLVNFQTEFKPTKSS